VYERKLNNIYSLKKPRLSKNLFEYPYQPTLNILLYV